ncbi:hypothetical protein COL26b_012915 [Colletotrichum chrysophilum]|uniref:uncharacterized protein n=1 Tax=Colletotrichum chrysophilum TaxID=1836956 RepID=UPI0023003E6D|nr:uncharacterized protein COL26b_012915 [Colletotrichum chrysophilum]KAJ0363525.1 hypothetical protein COL26b_012915 [Colletotrichum chrysophilum]
MPYPYYGPQAGDMSTISLEHAQAILRFLSQDSIVKRKIHDMHQNLIDQDIGRRLEVLRASESVEKSGGPVEDYESTEEEDDDEEDEEEEVEARNKKDEDPEVVIVGERQVVNKRKADDSFEVSVYAQKAKRGW